MPKNIIIFADGTGQVGGLRPDQRLSNIYKLYRAMRPGPDSPISPFEQVCYYDPGLGSEEAGGLTLNKTRKLLATAVGLGIDENVIDCYEKIISYHEPGDRVLLFGFSRGAYTVRAVANVMNLCGIPTQMPDGSPVPRHGPRLRKIASDGVHYVYNHGNGYPRTEEPYRTNREELGRRFRSKYASFVPGAEKDVQGNVQPTFIGVFDTVAALGSAQVTVMSAISIVAMLAATVIAFWVSWDWLGWILIAALLVVIYWYAKLKLSQWKYFSPVEQRPLKLTNPKDWLEIWKNGHYAKWNLKNYDLWLDSDVRHARHALAIDENRKNFPRVGWAKRSEAMKTIGRTPDWLKQVWFPGCHSDVGGSYPEPESRLSDIALGWMVDELKECVPEVQINHDMLHITPDSKGMQHEELYMFEFGPFKKRWPTEPRSVGTVFPLHPSVVERLAADRVSHLGEMRPYRPVQLNEHPAATEYYGKD